MGFLHLCWVKSKTGAGCLYVGIPFCPTTCLYCSFTSFPISAWKERVADYLTALEQEMDAVAQMYRDRILDTVYIGGGTPSSLSAAELDRLLTKLKEKFVFDTVQEFTVEAGRADSITEEKLKVPHSHCEKGRTGPPSHSSGLEMNLDQIFSSLWFPFSAFWSFWIQKLQKSQTGSQGVSA